MVEIAQKHRIKKPSTSKGAKKRILEEAFLAPKVEVGDGGSGHDSEDDESAPKEEAEKLSKTEIEELHLAWTKAFASAGLPPNAVEDVEVREAIRLTSLARCKYEPLRRRQMQGKYLRALNRNIDEQLTPLFSESLSMVLQCDGWDTSSKFNPINCLLSAIKGDEFLCDVDATRMDKNADWMATEILRMVGVCKLKHGREPDAVVTDNPTAMQSARARVKVAKPHMLLYSCILHG